MTHRRTIKTNRKAIMMDRKSMMTYKKSIMTYRKSIMTDRKIISHLLFLFIVKHTFKVTKNKNIVCFFCSILLLFEMIIINHDNVNIEIY